MIKKQAKPTCKGFTKFGTPCKIKAQFGDYCIWHHNRRNRNKHIENK